VQAGGSQITLKPQLDLKRIHAAGGKGRYFEQQYDATSPRRMHPGRHCWEQQASEIAAEDAVRIARDRVVQSQAELKTAQNSAEPR